MTTQLNKVKRRARNEMQSEIISAFGGMSRFDAAVSKGLIEFMGAFVIVFSVGMVIHQQMGVGMIAATFAGVLLVLHATFEKQHFNPFFSLQSFLFDVCSGTITGTTFALSLLQLMMIWGIQVAGSVAGAEALKWSFSNSQFVGATIPAANVPMGDVVFYEFIGSFAYAIAFYVLNAKIRVLDVDNAMAEIKITVIQHVVIPIVSAVIIFVATAVIFPYTGASINFIRSIGPAVISKQYHGLGYVFLGQATGYIGASILFNAQYCVKRLGYQRVLDN